MTENGQGKYEASQNEHELGLNIDTDRPRRTGTAEAVYAAGKTPKQVVAALRALRTAHPETPALATKCDIEHVEAIKLEFPPAEVDTVDDPRGTNILVTVGPVPEPRFGPIAVLTAGTSDLPIAEEAAATARANACAVTMISDVGVAGIHRLLRHAATLDQYRALIVVAGMDGALPTAVAGLTSVPLIAVPTSVGYGAAFGGLAPLLTMLNSCAPGVSVVNIDNGYGAAIAAYRIVSQHENLKG